MTREIEREGRCPDRAADNPPIESVRGVRLGSNELRDPVIIRSQQGATSTRALPRVHPPAARLSPKPLQLGRRGKILKRFRTQGTARTGHLLPRSRWCQRRRGRLLREPPLQVLRPSVHLDFQAVGHPVVPVRSVVSPRRSEQLVDHEIPLRRPAPHGQTGATSRERGANPDARNIARLDEGSRPLTRVRPRCGLSGAVVTTPDLEHDPTCRKLGASAINCWCPVANLPTC